MDKSVSEERQLAKAGMRQVRKNIYYITKMISGMSDKKEALNELSEALAVMNNALNACYSKITIRRNVMMMSAEEREMLKQLINEVKK